MGVVLGLLLVLSVVFSESRWYPNIEEGLRVAREEGKLVLFYFYEEGCSYCKYMEEVVFVDPHVSDLMERSFVVIPVDTEDPPPDLDKRFRVFGTPTFFIYDALKGKVIMEIVGMHESDIFLRLLKRACAKVEVRAC
ncbi:MAG TPA: DUF255 domain-containing protein [Aquificaceae bacterium]|nr:DUF255 domain-containing protein [Aquificaceae bacterium]